ncbi:MAG TPA: hypothetical protein DCM86_14165 [Verrucomicrobiales bacterium]|nr:hypothetical protein [Verrucomicrobiales bacterium]
MQQDIERFLNLQTKPARLTREQAAWFLGFTPEEVPILTARGLLHPLGHPAVNGQKYFLTARLEELRRDEKWFTRASDAITDYWRLKNSRKAQAGTISTASPQAAVETLRGLTSVR